MAVQYSFSHYGDGVSIKIKDRGVDLPRSKDRDVNGIRNADSAVRTGITPRLRMKSSDQSGFVGYSIMRLNEVHASTSFGDDERVDMALRFYDNQ
jgi:hypothetical protein